ncbi:glycosyl transferase [uncultured Helicobacter sp.]|nr:glycosyl transferase [uncultured Helicobacter sp.]
MLTLDCIALCIEQIGKCDMIWHDTEYVYEDEIESLSYPSLLESLHISQAEAIDKIYSPLDVWQHYEGFSWVHQGMFHIRLLDYLRFSPQIQSEDALFGMILFAKAQKIKIATKPLYIYRFHTYSTSEHNLQTNTPLKPYPNYMSDIAYTFCNRYKIKHYHFAYSCTYICLGLLAFIDTFPKNLSEYEKKLRDKLIAFLQVRAIYAFGGICFESDPKYIRDLLKPLEPYMQKISFNTKIAYFYPRLYRVLRFFKSYVRQGE